MRFEENFNKSSEISDRIQAIFDATKLKELSIKSGFVVNESELNGVKFANLCLRTIGEDGKMLSLIKLCVMLKILGARLCPQSLNERFNTRGVAFMKMLFEAVTKTRFDISVLNVLSSFSQVNVEDSTQFTLPEKFASLYQGSGGSASGAALKIDCIQDLKGDKLDLVLRHGRQADSSMKLPKQIEGKSLWLRDLGYWKYADFKRIKEAQAYFISRLKFGTKVYLSEDKDAQCIDLLSLIKKIKCNRVKDFQVFIGLKARVPVRLILQKVPKEVAEKKRLKLIKAARKKGQKVSKERLQFCDVNAIITNLKEEEWDAYDVMKLYKIRWQIEILFKVWKSVLKLGQVKEVKPERFLCLLYGQLIWTVINMKLFQAFKIEIWRKFRKEISEIKSYSIMKAFDKMLKEAIFLNCEILYEECINMMYQEIYRLGEKQCKKGNPYPLFIYE